MTDASLVAPFAPPYVNIPKPGQPYLWMMIGPPGAGKSTWITRLLARTSVPKVVISTDHWIDCLAYSAWLDYSAAFGKVDFKAIEAAAFREFEEAVAARSDIVVDRTNMTRGSRARWLNRVPKGTYYRIGVVFMPCRVILDERLESRAVETGKRIPPNVIDDMIAKYQPPIMGEFDAVQRGGEIPGFPPA